MKQQAPENRIWTTRAITTVATGFILYWVGLLFRNTHLIVGAAILLSIIAIASASSTTPNIQFSVLREVSPDRTVEDNLVSIKTSVSNNSTEPALIHFTETFPSELDLFQGSSTYLVQANPMSTCNVTNVLRPIFRGHYVIPPVSGESTDELGLRRSMPRPGKATYLSVLPAIEDLSSFPLETKSSQPEIGTFRSASVGVGTEFFGIRDYVPGDEWRHINWKASGRHTGLLSNEYEREHVTNIYMLVDLTAGNLNDLKWSVRVASSLATYLLKTRNRVGLLVIGEGVSHIKIEGGRRQLLRIIDKLVTAVPGGSGEFSTYLRLAIDQLPFACQMLLVSSLRNENIVKTTISIHQRREHLTVLTLHEPKRPPFENMVLEMARLMQTLKSRTSMLRLRDAGIQVIQIPAGASLSTSLSTLRERPLRR